MLLREVVGRTEMSFFLPGDRNMFSCRSRSRFFLRIEIGAGYLRFSALWEVECVFFPYIYIVRVHVCVRTYTRFTGSGQYELFLPAVCDVELRASRPRKDDCFNKMKNQITQTEGEGRKNIFLSVAVSIFYV